MATAAEAKAAIDAGFTAYIGELEKCAGAWETKPAGGEGEESWNARQVAEHIGGSGPFFGMGIAKALGVDGPTPAQMTFPDHGTAVSETRRTHGLLMDVVAKVTDANIGTEFESSRMGKQTVGGMMGIVSYHLNDHAQQLKTLRGG